VAAPSPVLGRPSALPSPGIPSTRRAPGTRWAALIVDIRAASHAAAPGVAHRAVKHALAMHCRCEVSRGHSRRWPALRPGRHHERRGERGTPGRCRAGPEAAPVTSAQPPDPQVPAAAAAPRRVPVLPLYQGMEAVMSAWSPSRTQLRQMVAPPPGGAAGGHLGRSHLEHDTTIVVRMSTTVVVNERNDAHGGLGKRSVTRYTQA
jgi:hypothetical protein